MGGELQIAWAKKESIRLRSLAGKGEISTKNTKAVIAQGVEFLRQNAGQQSAFYQQADLIRRGSWAFEYSLKMMADLLDGWVTYSESGMAEGLPFEARFRIEASTDLMEQAGSLLEDPRIHVAAPIVLAGAALEEFLRSLIESEGIQFKRKPGISAYAHELKSAGVLTTQDIKDVEAWAGQRNEAAHGKFEGLSLPRARLLVDGINLFMRQKSPTGNPVT